MRLPAISVDQPIGTFYICSIPYRILEQVAFPDALTLTDAGEHLPSYYQLTGAQREFIKERRRKIGDYISTAEATFPNTIILAANITEDGRILEDDENSSSSRWTIEYDEKCQIYWLTIPDTSLMLARIIDGQHRVRGFKYSVQPRPENFELPCSIFLDMSMPEQASIFATININQTRVDRSLAYNLFAYNLDDEPKEAWAPDKLAVFLTRRLSVEDGSPLKGHIKVIARQGRKVYSLTDWVVSTSVIVDGICGLISKNAQRDRDKLGRYPKDRRNRQAILSEDSDSSPLRMQYLEVNDIVIYKIVFNYFTAVKEAIFDRQVERGFMTKSIGIQALFDFLQEICSEAILQKDISAEFFRKYFVDFQRVDFTKGQFPANAQGRAQIRNLLYFANNMPTKRSLKKEDIELFNELLNRT